MQLWEWYLVGTLARSQGRDRKGTDWDGWPAAPFRFLRFLISGIVRFEMGFLLQSPFTPTTILTYLDECPVWQYSGNQKQPTYITQLKL